MFDVTVLPVNPETGLAAHTQFQLPGALTPPAVIHTDVDLALAPGAELGQHVLTLEGAPGETFELGSVEVAGRRRTWEAPKDVRETRATFGSAVELIGVTAPPTMTVSAGQIVTVTLVWDVLQPPGRDIARFLHVLGPDGMFVTQRSGVPCAGRDSASPDDACPSTSWLPNEILVDTVEVTLPADLPPGRYPLATGWYDPATLERLPARDGQEVRAPDDIVRLPVELVIP